MKWLAEDARLWWRYWSTRIQLACAFLTGWLWFDPSSLLYAWNLMPRPMRALLPEHFVTAIGAVLFLLSIAGVLARVTRQPKLEEKRRDG